MPTLPRRGSMIEGKAGRRRARRLRWSINGLKDTEPARVQSGEVGELLCELLNELEKKSDHRLAVSSSLHTYKPQSELF
jgi:hypothetical protein